MISTHFVTSKRLRHVENCFASLARCHETALPVQVWPSGDLVHKYEHRQAEFRSKKCRWQALILHGRRTPFAGKRNVPRFPPGMSPTYLKRPELHMAAVAHIFGRAHGSGEIERNGRGNNLLHKMKHLAASHHISACATSVTTDTPCLCQGPVTENLPQHRFSARKCAKIVEVAACDVERLQSARW